MQGKKLASFFFGCDKIWMVCGQVAFETSLPASWKITWVYATTQSINAATLNLTVNFILIPWHNTFNCVNGWRIEPLVELSSRHWPISLWNTWLCIGFNLSSQFPFFKKTKGPSRQNENDPTKRHPSRNSKAKKNLKFNKIWPKMFYVVKMKNLSLAQLIYSNLLSSFTTNPFTQPIIMATPTSTPTASKSFPHYIWSETEDDEHFYEENNLTALTPKSQLPPKIQAPKVKKKFFFS